MGPSLPKELIPKCFGDYCPVQMACMKECSLSEECAYKHAIEETNTWIRTLRERANKLKLSHTEDRLIELLLVNINRLELTRVKRWDIHANP